MADEYIKIAIAAADQNKQDKNLAPQEIARTTTPPHCLTCSVRVTHLPNQLVSTSTPRRQKLQGNPILPFGINCSHVVPFMDVPCHFSRYKIYKSLDYCARKDLARFVIIKKNHCRKKFRPSRCTKKQIF